MIGFICIATIEALVFYRLGLGRGFTMGRKFGQEIAEGVGLVIREFVRAQKLEPQFNEFVSDGLKTATLALRELSNKKATTTDPGASNVIR